MPGFLNHYLFGENVYNGFKNTKLKQYITEHRELFNLGTQGPDIFFYYLPCNLSSKKKLGNVMHSNHTNLLFRNMMDVLHAERDPDKQRVGLAYLGGLLCHYMLDSRTHPYIYYRTALEGKSTIANGANHISFETVMDNNMLMEVHQKVPSQVKLHKFISASKDELRTASDYLSDTLLHTFPDANYALPGFVNKAMHAMIREVRLLQDRTGIKRGVLKGIEFITVRVPIVSGMVPIDQPHPELDSLNMNCSTWENPFCPERRKRTDSFPMMFYAAASETIPILEQLSQLFECKSTNYALKRDQLLKKIGNLTYNTGLDSD